jgi:hypothetical protein
MHDATVSAGCSVLAPDDLVLSLLHVTDSIQQERRMKSDGEASALRTDLS